MVAFITNIISKFETLVVGAFFGILAYFLIFRFINKQYPFDIWTAESLVEESVVEEAPEARKDEVSIKEDMTNIISIPVPMGEYQQYAVVE